MEPVDSFRINFVFTFKAVHIVSNISQKKIVINIAQNNSVFNIPHNYEFSGYKCLAGFEVRLFLPAASWRGLR